MTKLKMAAAVIGVAALGMVSRTASSQEALCTGRDHSVSINDSGNNSARTIKWRIGRCRGTASMRGDIQFMGDMSGIARMSSDARFELSDDDGDHTHDLVVTNTGGRPSYALRIDDRAVEWNDAARAWFASALLTLARRTGLAYEERIDYLMSHGGVDAVLAEVRLMDSDWVQRRYLQGTMTRGKLTQSQVAQLVSTASNELQSNYEQAEFLIGIASRYALDRTVRTPYLAAVATIESDYEKGRVLKTLLKQPDLAKEELAQVILAAGTISSNYERAEVLRQVASFDLSSEPLQEAFLKVASGMDSSYELRRSLMAVLDKQRVAPGALNIALSAADRIDSNHERAELLLHIVQNYQLTAEQRSRVIKAADGLESEYERGRVSAALVRRMNTSN